MYENIVLRMQSGDKSAFEELFDDEYRKLLFVLAKARTGDDEDAKDIVQETMLEAYRSIKKLKKSDSVKCWITKILINKCQTLYRDKNRYNILYGHNIMEFENETEDIEENLADNIDLFDVIKVLKWKDRKIILLHLAGYTSKEMANILDMNENTIRTKIMRIKSIIKNLMRDGEGI